MIEDLISFTLILADPDDRQVKNRTKLNRSGPDVGACPGYVFPSHAIYKAAIYADKYRVYGIRLLSAQGVSDIGSLRGTPVLEEFSTNELPIGFYGTYNEAGITSLGFLVHDPACINTKAPVIEEVPEPEPVAPKPLQAPVPLKLIAEVESETGPVVLAIVVPVIISIGGIIALFVWLYYRKRRPKSDLSTIKPDTAVEGEEKDEAVQKKKKIMGRGIPSVIMDEDFAAKISGSFVFQHHGPPAEGHMAPVHSAETEGDSAAPWKPEHIEPENDANEEDQNNAS